MYIYAILLLLLLLLKGLLPIHIASSYGQVDMIRALTKLGSDPRSPTHDQVRTYTTALPTKLMRILTASLQTLSD